MILDILSAQLLGKRYGQVRALCDVSFSIAAGEIVGLVGDNGAGKSTLVGILAGAISPTEGSVWLRGERLVDGNPAKSREAGIEVVFQDLALSLDLDVADNVFLGRERVKRGRVARALGWLDRQAMRDQAADLIADLNVRIPGTRRPVRDFSGGQRQGVAVARATAWASSVLLLDEPTAALGVEQQETVADMVRRAANSGIGVLLVSHNLPQVVALCDRVLVLWHGELIADLQNNDLTTDDLLRWITGSNHKGKS